MSSVANKLSEEKIKLLNEWKQKYEEALIDALKPSGNVLELGFENGFGAEQIQKYHPKALTIIESDLQRYQAAVQWAGKKTNVSVIQGTWENELAKLGAFDAIFFNECSIGCEIGMFHFLFPEDFAEASNHAKQVLSDIEEQMSKLHVKYSDQDIKEFYQNIGRFNMQEMPKFLQNLKQNGNITSAQYDNIIKNYHIDENVSKNLSKTANTPDKLLLFLEECVKNHMNKGCRFSAFLPCQVSKYENSLFADRIISNAKVDYTETMIPVKMSDRTREAIFILATKH